MRNIQRKMWRKNEGERNNDKCRVCVCESEGERKRGRGI